MALTISERCLNITPSMTLQIDAKAKEMKAAGMNVIGFGAGEPDFPTPVHIREAAKQALDLGLTRYTPVPGTMDLRKAICGKLQRENGLSYEPQNIIVSDGAKHTLFNIFQAILNPGDEVLIPTPCWVSYPEMVRMAGGVPVFVRTVEEENFIPSADAVAAKITPRTKAMVITSPSNPNGSVWTREQLADVAKLALENAFWLISDEIYERLLYDGLRHVSVAQLGEDIKEQTFVVNGMSKAYCMTGWRVGYCAAPKKAVAAMSAFQSQSTSNANSVAQYASVAALNGDQKCVDQMVAEYEKRRNLITDRINAIPGLSCRRPQGAFYVMMNVSGVLGRGLNGVVIKDSLTFAEQLLKEKQVAVVPGVAFEAEGYCRLSYAISADTISEGLDRVAAFVSALE